MIIGRRDWLAHTGLLALLASVADARAHAPAANVDELGLSNAAPALAARYGVRLTPAAANGPIRNLDWVFVRGPERIELRKGSVDEAWTRDARGRVAFERTFHEHARIVDYNPGELATLGVDIDWQALARFIDPHELAALPVRSRSGKGTALRMRLEGRVGEERLRVDWLPALQLPALILRDNPRRGRTRIELMAHASVPQPGWPQPDLRAAGYLHLDAADFGDMDHEPVVRLSEALDIRGGWRRPHSHD